jgi:hypothetical protein
VKPDRRRSDLATETGKPDIEIIFGMQHARGVGEHVLLWRR